MKINSFLLGQILFTVVTIMIGSEKKDHFAPNIIFELSMPLERAFREPQNGL